MSGRASRIGLSFAAVVVLLGPGTAQAHEPRVQSEAQPGAEAPAEAAAPFPFQIGGPFALIDHRGRAVTDRDFLGSYLLVFFGYANCRSVCPIALPRMAEALAFLGERGAKVQPVLITVDPESDTPDALAAFVPKIHPRLIGLTGGPEALAAVAKAYRVESSRTGRSWSGRTVFNHGSYIYLMGPDGKFRTLLPPVMGAARMAATIARYL